MNKLLRVLFLISVLVWSAVSVDAQEHIDDPYIPSILVVDNEDDFQALLDAGVIVWHRRADMVLCAVPKDTNILRHAPSTAPHKYRPRIKPALDIARTYFGADKINIGENLPSPFTGKGVVVGFCDSGFDPNHVAFLGQDGNPRVKMLVNYDEPKGIRTVLTTPDEIRGWTTDDVEMSHATHVAGIMAGGFLGNEYRGMAPDAEIVATTTKLYDAGILAACEDILDYARNVGKPAVINLSLGSYNGPHDGSTLFNRYLALIGEEAIVCIAAGNEGDDYNSYRITFSDSKPKWRARIHSSDWAQFDMYGMTDFWSADDRPAGIKFMIFDGVTGPVYEKDIRFDTGEEEIIISTLTDTDFANYMRGNVLFRAGICPDNGRWRCEMEYDTHTEEPHPSSGGTWARYTLGFEVYGQPGVHVDVTSDCQYSRLVQWPGFAAPTADLSISDIATGDNVICVGMYNNRAEAPLLSGDVRNLEEPLLVNQGSGYGVLIDNRMLPHTVAPGAWVISAASGPFAKEHPDKIAGYSAKAVYEGNTFYWDLNGGTSMSTPYVAGVVATWLEADPTLDFNRVLDIIYETNLHEYKNPEDPRHGHGWFNPYAGIRSVLGLSSVTPGKLDTSEIKIQILDGTAEIFNPSASNLNITIARTDGGVVFSKFVSGETYSSISLDNIGKGMFILSCQSRTQNIQTVKFLK